MGVIINSEKYKELCAEIEKLISAELEHPEDIEASYPKFIIMYEFFCLLRGEAFTAHRDPTPEFQKELYAIEDKIGKRVLQLKNSIPENSTKAKFHFDNMVSQNLKL